MKRSREKSFPQFIAGLPADWDDSATTYDIHLEHPPHIGRDSIHFRWWGTRYLVSRDICSAIIRAMTPLQLLIVDFRLQGLPDDEIANILHMTPAALRQHMTRLRKRIYEEVPCIRATLRNRYRYQPPSP
jgi:DNA-directed RNA polymerase specialized sigma24 family protein